MFCDLQMVGVDRVWSCEINNKWRRVFWGRNNAMRKWARSQPSGRVSILDFDGLSWADNAPLGLISNWTDPHYGTLAPCTLLHFV